jgi:hypothetical protein
VSAGQFTVPVTVLQRAQMTQIGAHHGRHRLTCRLRQIGGSVNVVRSLCYLGPTASGLDDDLG